jgi:hypothetical protein
LSFISNFGVVIPWVMLLTIEWITIHTWLKKVGFENIKLLDITKTTPQEQRATHWIGDNTQSIKDFLDPNNDDLTVAFWHNGLWE